MIIEFHHANGTIDIHKGPSQAELKTEHDAGACDAWCAYCYDEACQGAE